MTPPDPWREVSAAHLPAAALPALARVRNRPGIRVHPEGDLVWVCWPAGQTETVRCLLPVRGVAFFTNRGGVWYLFRSRLPADTKPPAGEGKPLSAVLVPARFEAVPPDAAPPAAAKLTVVRGGEPRPASALACTPANLLRWADEATTAELAAVRAAVAGERVLVLGSHLPSIADAVRCWGEDVLVPLGYRPEPALPPDALRVAAGAADGELLLLGEDGAELIPRAAFTPLTRAGVRLGAKRS